MGPIQTRIKCSNRITGSPEYHKVFLSKKGRLHTECNDNRCRELMEDWTHSFRSVGTYAYRPKPPKRKFPSRLRRHREEQLTKSFERHQEQKNYRVGRGVIHYYKDTDVGNINLNALRAESNVRGHHPTLTGVRYYRHDKQVRVADVFRRKFTKLNFPDWCLIHGGYWSTAKTIKWFQLLLPYRNLLPELEEGERCDTIFIDGVDNDLESRIVLLISGGRHPHHCRRRLVELKRDPKRSNVVITTTSVSL